MAFPYNGASSLGSPQASNELSVYRSYLFTEPFGRSPLTTDQGTVNLGRLLEIFKKSVDHFTRHNRLRTVERLRLEMARLNMENGEVNTALQLLLPLWQELSWRREGWWDLVAEVDWALRDCARHVGDERTLIAVEWELLCNCECRYLNSGVICMILAWLIELLPDLPLRSDHHYEFLRCLDGVESCGTRPKATLSSDNVLSCSEYWPSSLSEQE